ncbi:MAG: phosphoribosylaminoimidazolesuccinocarboxamide synthase [Oscillospiraceae bacterium]|nr:phosphoribosylaminoimidazolesuccinocarboxamide synthase [Oscillospiraceae bacterium]
MQQVYKGKTKDVYKLDNGQYLLKFKDDMTGEDGKFDPGANTIGLSVEGAGRAGLRLTEYFYTHIENAGYPTHFIAADVDAATLTAKPAEVIGKGLEVICRFRAAGSFLRRYGDYCTEGQQLDAFVEMTLKDDERGDPPISRDAAAMLGLLSHDEYDRLVVLTQEISRLIKQLLAKKGLDLYDIKLEFGRIDGQIALMDEISGGNMRVYKDGVYVEPLGLVDLILG